MLFCQEAEVQEARKFIAFHTNSELLKEKLIEEKGRREKVEAELSKLQDVQLSAQKLELELVSWKSLLEELPDVSSLSDIPKKFAALQKYVLIIQDNLKFITLWRLLVVSVSL